MWRHGSTQISWIQILFGSRFIRSRHTPLTEINMWNTCEAHVEHMWNSCEEVCDTHVKPMWNTREYARFTCGYWNFTCEETCETHVFSHMKFHMWKFTCEISHVKFHVWITCEISHVEISCVNHMWNFTCEISHVKYHMWNFTGEISHVFHTVKFHMWNFTCQNKFHMWKSHVEFHMWNFTRENSSPEGEGMHYKRYRWKDIAPLLLYMCVYISDKTFDRPGLWVHSICLKNRRILTVPNSQFFFDFSSTVLFHFLSFRWNFILMFITKSVGVTTSSWRVLSPVDHMAHMASCRRRWSCRPGRLQPGLSRLRYKVNILRRIIWCRILGPIIGKGVG